METLASAGAQAAPNEGQTSAQSDVSGVGLLDASIDIMGTEGRSLSMAFGAWQREQERLANRAWRRPGGLARLAGV